MIISKNTTLKKIHSNPEAYIVIVNNCPIDMFLVGDIRKIESIDKKLVENAIHGLRIGDVLNVDIEKLAQLLCSDSCLYPNLSVKELFNLTTFAMCEANKLAPIVRSEQKLTVVR